jgi:hypothetical protein
MDHSEGGSSTSCAAAPAAIGISDAAIIVARAISNPAQPPIIVNSVIPAIRGNRRTTTAMILFY